MPSLSLPKFLAGLVLALVIGIFPKSDGRGKTKDDEYFSFLQQEILDLENRLDNSFKVVGDKDGRNCSALSLEAQKWMEETDKELGRRLSLESHANWNYLTNITKENALELEREVADSEAWMATVLIKANYYLANSNQICNDTTIRLLRLLTQLGSVPIAKNLTTRGRITRLMNEMQEIYATTTVTRDGKTYRLSPELSNIMSKSRDYEELLWAWTAWHNTTGRKLKRFYAELVEKLNEAAADNGFPDVGVFWKYSDFDQSSIEEEMDRLYSELLPFYTHLHAYVRKLLAKRYKGVDSAGCIPTHLLGNMWAQEWISLDDILLPFPNTSSNYDVTQAMIDQGYTPERMFRLSEEFFTSIGLEPMTSDFWNKSVIVRPADNRPIECHASAEEFFSQTDFRIKMCTEITADDLQTVHHEMGHVEYFMLYRNQPTVFRTGANAAFHEAVGDTIALSVMSDTHLAAVGLIPSNSVQYSSNEIYEQDINFLMRMALQKIAFLPFGYTIDKWRYKVFRGEILPEDYTSSWWKLREYYGGISAPIPRSSDEFDPGAKYHIPANVPYARYFFSFIGQFQFHSTLCKLAGHKGPLHKCDIYRSKKAGKRLRSVLSLGASRSWQETMQKFTGQRNFRLDAILEYFQPLIDWLKKENEGIPTGWRLEEETQGDIDKKSQL